MDGMKFCRCCNRWLPIERFHRRGWRGRHARCYLCRKIPGYKIVRPSIWTPELTARLRELWDQGLGPSAIARELDLTKGTVSGKMWREGLEITGDRAQTSRGRLDALWKQMDAAMDLPVPRVAPSKEIVPARLGSW